MAIGGFSKTRNLLAQKRLQKRKSVRRVLLESLEARQLFAVGPQLLGIQPNTGELLESGDILHVSPRELVFRFDDAVGIDPNSLDGIRVIRSGADGIFERATVATDFGTNGQTLVEFYAREAGEAGNGLQLTFSRVSRGDSRAPILRVDGRTIDIELNSNPNLLTRVEDVLNAFDPAVDSPATRLVYALRLQGSTTIPVTPTADTVRPFTLNGANAAKASTNFGLGNVEVRLVSLESGNAGLDLNVTVTARDRGGAGNPIVTVIGKNINVELNSNSRFPTTVQEFVDAINASDSLSSSLIDAQLVTGIGATRIGAAPITYSPIGFSGVTDIEIVPAYVGLGDTNREVVLRFAEALPDDFYRIEILGQGVRTLRSIDGAVFNQGVSRSIAFELDLGALVESVVPQPVSRNAAGNLVQRANEIDVYFNDDDLIALDSIVSVNGIPFNNFRSLRTPMFFQSSDIITFATNSLGSRSVLDPAFYQLFHTRNSLNSNDDTKFTPDSVRYYPDADRVTLAFRNNLDSLRDAANAILPAAELRLRIGTNEAQAMAPVAFTPAADPADTFVGAQPLNTWTPGGAGSQSLLISSDINNSDTSPLLMDFPGGSDEPGERSNRHQNALRLSADSEDGTSIQFYNFKGDLGVFSVSNLLNAITEQQKERVREVFSLYEQHLGIRFVETDNLGMTIGVGDMRAIVPFEEIAGSGVPGVIELNGVGGTFYEAGTLRSDGSLATVLDLQDFSSSTLSEYAGPFQRAAMQAVGRLLGLALSDDVDGLTIQSFDAVFAPGVGTEIILPGDNDIVRGQFLYRPDSKDIDLYQFSVPVDGRITIEAFAERMSTASLLDTQIRLYQQNPLGAWEEIAANDDYSSSDSYLQLDLEQGNYIVGVSASGNSSYDPNISDSGIGGRSEGNYQLRMDFTPPAAGVLRDGTGTVLDGDSDGAPDGVFNFWFRPSGASNTKFVDKQATAGGNGSLATPFKHIKDALAVAQPGDVVRIVGNGGADRLVSTAADNLAYEVGFDTRGVALPDGSTFTVPKGVSVMIDAGAVLKMRRARVGVGSTTVSVDKSGGSLLVLGTPKLLDVNGSVIKDAAGNAVAGSVYFTSASDTTLGKNANPSVVGISAGAGDWGGLDFRNRIDASLGRENLEVNGQFLNWVSHADIRYGGGQVVVDSNSQSITPIQMIDARPTIAFSSITSSADAAMGATPNSFKDSNFHSPAEQQLASFTVDYQRVGPDIHNNRVVGNTINGLQIRLRTSGNPQLETMTVQGRFDDTDIVHFLPENLEITGTPGGALLRNDVPAGTPTPLVTRLDARLAIDAGTVIKSQGSRIDVDFGAQLIAEGDDGLPVVFTSLNDVRYGAGGTFDTANRAGAQDAAAGDWGGIYVGQTSKASLDYAVVAFGGGTTRVEGDFADFNAIEVQQGELRLTHSRIESNANGSTVATSPDRGGRGTNDVGAVFVRGAQPIIVDNVIKDNLGPAISINVSSLNFQSVDDMGRSRGLADKFDEIVGNQGPMISQNRIDNNSINGVTVRGGTLTTEGVWDDTDIVHVVFDEIVVPDYHTFGGVQLVSAADESLVVKFSGATAGFTATGTPLDNANRIGGSVQVIGNPDHPVILTSLDDCSVGAGFTVDGIHQVDTNNTGFCTGSDTVDFADIIVVVDESASMGFAQQFSIGLMADLDAALSAAGIGASAAGGNQFGLVGYASSNPAPRAIPLGAAGELFGTSTEYATAAASLLVDGFEEDGYEAIHFALDTYSFRENSARFVILVTNEDRDIRDASLTYDNTLARLNAQNVVLEGILSADFLDSQGSSALALNAQSNAYTEDGNGGFTVTPNGSVSPFFFDTTVVDYVDMVFDTNGLAGDINQIQFGGVTAESFGNAMVSSIVGQAGGNPAAPGDWRSVLLDTYSNDRNVASVAETESPLSSSTGTNDSTNSGQFLGSLAPNVKSGDENQRLGFNIQADLAKPGDVDVYSFRADAGTEVWLDIDRTNNAVDTVVELVDADGGILALSDDSLLEEANGSVTFTDTARMPVQGANPLRRSEPEFYFESALGTPKDLFSTNPKDAGLRVRLPGEPGSNNLYHVRVRSSNTTSTDPATKLASLLDLSKLAGGLTKGSYQLQLRLTEVDEVPGSSITYADIRFAVSGVQLVGVPGNSPLLGENSEVEVTATGVQNDLFANAQPLGNLLATNRQAISVAGNIDDFTDVDWFSFVLDYQRTTPTALREYFATVFDVDYADGIGRPDTSLYVFDAAGNLILGGLGSNLVDDQASPNKGADNSDLSRGSAGSLDPFIGSYEMPVGTYFLAVTNSNMIPEVLATYTDPASTSPFIRLQPVEGVQLIAEDHVGFSGGSTALPPQIPVLFDPVESVVDFNLSDVVLYVSQNVGTELTNLYQVNPFTGETRNQVGRGRFDVQDIAFRPNGELRAFDRTILANVGTADRDGFLDYINIDPGTGAFTATPAPIQTFYVDQSVAPPVAVAADDGYNPEAIAFGIVNSQERGYFVGNRPTPPGSDPNFPQTRFIPAGPNNTPPAVGFDRPGVSMFTNVLFEFDEATGQAYSAPAQDKTGVLQGFGTGTAIQERGYIETYTLDPLTGNPVTRATQLVASEVTESRANAAPSFLIQDGQVFSVIDGTGFVTRFEFDLGPEVLVNYDPVNGPTVVDGMKFSIDGQVYEFEISAGAPGVTAGAIAIPLPANASLRQFVDAIAGRVTGATVSYESGRMNFSGANTGDFTELEAAGVFTDLGSSGAVGGGNIVVRVLASDTAETVAARIVQAVGTAGIISLNATANGNIVSFFGASVLNSGPLATAGVAPGGLVTGITVLDGSLFAVSDRGGLYRVANPTVARSGNVATYVTSSFDLIGIEFSALTKGPEHLQNGALSNMLFGLDTSGNLHAFDTFGRLQPVFANGATSISTGIFNANGLALSTLDFNLWHQSGNRAGDAGHGLPDTPNDSRINTVSGGSSLYFGYESAGANGVFDLVGPNSTGLQNSYNFPGGAAGALESATFSLASIGAGDLPTLYFNYFFETEQAASDFPTGSTATDYMRDALRVYVSGEDGVWTLVATNNERSNNFDEFDTGPDVQPLFDNNNQWRQARVPLDQFAGQDHVKLRIEFSTAGGFGYGLNGGKGPEIRTTSGATLADGETLTINGQTFEIELGPTLAFTGGSGIASGTSVTIDGTNYVFTDGSTAVTAPDVPVNYLLGMNAEEIASALQTAILSTVNSPTVVSGLTYNREGNETISVAEQTGIVGDSTEVTGTGQIGDNASLADPAEDVDMIRIDVERGAQVSVATLAAGIGSGLDTFLRVFDSEGRPLRNAFGGLVQNDNSGGTNDSRLTFTAQESGIYYIGVSSAGNQNYNSAVSGNATAGTTTGNYSLTITVNRRLVPTVAGNRLQLDGARVVTISSGSGISLQGDLGTTGEPVFVSIDMTRAQVAAALQQGIANFFADGLTSAYPIRGGDTLELTGLSTFGIDAGPFGLTTNFSGDFFGAFNAGTNFDGSTSNSRPGTLGAQNNAFEGVYLDDFIIGIAGRGEMALNGNGNTNFIRDPLTLPPFGNPEIVVGPYQLEIRGGETYGTPTLIDIDLVDSVDIDSRLGSGFSITFNPAAVLVAGQTFTVGDGTRILTFELDDVNDGVAVTPGNIALAFNTAVVNPVTGATTSESAKIIAARFRDLLNSPAVQAEIDLTAGLSNNDGIGATSSTVVLLGTAAVNIPTSIGTVELSNREGGLNRQREQGQVVINSVRVSNSLDFGITISSAARETSANPLLNTNAPNPGSPRNTVSLNVDRLAPGAVVMNSEFIANSAGGISVNGDPQTVGVPVAAVPFVRLVNNTILGGTVTSVLALTPTIVDGQVFDTGSLAFADVVSAYNPMQAGGPAPLTGLDDQTQAIGVPNFSGFGEPLTGEGVVSLGRGGQIVLQFTNNLLTGSGDGNPDLMIFEVGDSEEVLVEISSDGTRYTAVGRASAASPTVDIDAFGFNQNSRVSFVRLTDIANQGSQTGDSVGADIDAVGAISSVAVENYNAGGTGVSVANNGTATILNSVLVNNDTGIAIDTSSTSTVVGGTIYQRNTANVGGSATLGQFPNVLGNTVSVFVNAGAGNLYPSPASPIIDSSIDSLEDRPSLVAVKRPLGLAASPILAPQLDINGQLRVDDPAVETPSGLGEDVFKDRGAQDRADFIGPSVFLVNPIDNDLAGLDANPEESIVELSGFTPLYFDIQLVDGLEPSDPGRGSGVKNATVSSASILVYRNNVPLVEGVDYKFGYDSTNGLIRLQPLAGIWQSQSVYTIRFLNSKEASIVAKEASVYNDGDQLQVVDAGGSSSTFEIDLGYLVKVPSANGVDVDLTDGATFTLDDGSRQLTFEFDFEGSVAAGNVRVNLGATPTIESAARAIAFAITNVGMSLTAEEVQPGLLQIQGSGLVKLDVGTTGLEVTGQPGVQTVFGLQIPQIAGRPDGLLDGETFTIDRSGSPVSFELDTNGITLPGNIPVRYFAGASSAQIGAALVTAIDSAALGLSPSYDGNGLVRLGGDRNTRLDLTATGLTQAGIAGQSASVAIPVSAKATAPEVATAIKSRIEAANLTGVTITQFGARLVVEGAVGVGGVGAGEISAIRDLAGNPLKPNQIDGSTTLTVFLGEGLDYGDAPSPYLSTRADGGPSHKVVTGLSLGATVSPDADAKLVNADNDDGFGFTSEIFAAFQTNAQFTVTNETGQNAHASVWIDFNRDGIFTTTERVVNSLLVTQPTTNLSFLVPSSALTGETYARIRLSTNAAAITSPVGAAPDGEVEDYAITILGNPYTNGALNLDVNADLSVSPIDVLQVINWINDPLKPNTLSAAARTGAPPFIDVNGDGIVSGVDVLQIVNFLNSRPASGEGELGSFVDLQANSGEQTVLASNWAAGLETMLVNNRQPTQKPQVANDMALLLDDGGDELLAIDVVASTNIMAADDSFWADWGDQDDSEGSENGDENPVFHNFLG
jgi:hypothetical protein